LFMCGGTELNAFCKELAWCEDINYMECTQEIKPVFAKWIDTFEIELMRRQICEELIKGPVCKIAALMMHVLIGYPYPNNILQSGVLTGTIAKVEET